MILLLDAGNTRLKWLLKQSDDVIAQGAAMWEEGFAQLSQHLSAVSALDRILVASVRRQADNDKLIEYFAARYSCSVEFAVSRASQLGLVNGYSSPESLGVDRWLSMLAAWDELQVPLVVVSAGTALTVDLVNERGLHLGGYIAPSAYGFAAALNRTAAGINVSISSAGLVPGSSTEMAVANAYGTMVQQLVLSAMGALGGGTRLLLTGGDGVAIASFFSDVNIRGQLVFAGLELYFGLKAGYEKGRAPCA